MTLTRRALLQQASLALASVGLSQMGLSRLTRRYQNVLAAPTSRKLALLIGINQYADEVCGFSNSKGTLLQGSITDVELHRELLISRFGFLPSDIVTLVDKQATRNGIETALQSHLLDQAREHDVVVFHFSGLGSTVQFSSELESESGAFADENSAVYQTLVPFDGVLPSPEAPNLRDFLQATLASYLKALPTKNVISLLDIGYQSPGALLGNLRVRSRLEPLQNVLLKDASSLQRRRRKGKSIDLISRFPFLDRSFPGVLLTGANDQGIATETPWDGFSAGVLTYMLTQRLWNTTSETSIQISLAQTTSAIEQLVGPQYQTMVSSLSSSVKPTRPLSAYLESSPPALSADGSVLKHDEDKGSLELWLAGLAPTVLQYCSAASYLECFTFNPVTSPKGENATANLAETENREDSFILLQGRSHNGLKVTARPVPSANSSIAVDSIPVGSLIQEKIRAIPKDVKLIVALDRDLERIERVDATSSLSAISKVTSSVAGEQHADCLFGRINASDLPLSEKKSPSNVEAGNNARDKRDSDDAEASIQQMYGIFRPGRSLIDNTLSLSGEAIKTAIHHLEPQLQGLLALKLLQLTENQTGSRLGLEVSLETVTLKSSQQAQRLSQSIMVQATSRSGLTPEQSLALQWTGNSAMPSVEMGDYIQYRFNNYGDRPLYCLLINVDSKGSITALYPSGTPSSRARKAQSASSKVSSNKSLDERLLPDHAVTVVPRTDRAVPWSINSSPGLVTTYVIVSCKSFTKTINRLPQLKQSGGNARTMIPLPDPLAVVHSILQDLDDASQPMIERLALDVTSDRYNLDMACWATFTFTYKVTEQTSLLVQV
ncbi:MAG: caspase family protein [Cyanobacteria bacterium P01_F01_bin.150]